STSFMRTMAKVRQEARDRIRNASKRKATRISKRSSLSWTTSKPHESWSNHFTSCSSVPASNGIEGDHSSYRSPSSLGGRRQQQTPGSYSFHRDACKLRICSWVDNASRKQIP